MEVGVYEIGALYIQPHGPDGNWRQPGGVGTIVFPQQPSGNSDILSILPFSSLTGTYMFGCGHSCNMCQIYKDVDVSDNTPVAILACAQCSFVQRVIKPWSDAFIGSVSYLQNAILFP